MLEAASALADFQNNLAGLLAAAQGGAERAEAAMAEPEAVNISAQAVYARTPTAAAAADYAAAESAAHSQPATQRLPPPAAAGQQPQPGGVTPAVIEKAQREAIAAVKNKEDSTLSHLREVRCCRCRSRSCGQSP